MRISAVSPTGDMHSPELSLQGDIYVSVSDLKSAWEYIPSDCC
jgi:hypothetical protein